jgi:acetyl esterase
MLAGGVRAVFSLPRPLRRALAGPPLYREGQRLDLDMQVFLRLQRLTGRGLVDTTPEHARRHVEEGDRILRGRLVQPVVTRDLTIPDGPAARLYAPLDPAPGDGLLVYYHGGGWVVGSLDSHDNVCRFLARHAAARVLSVAYRLAPEHRFPAAVEDAYTGFRYARRLAAELGINPDAVAVGGDSAGGNLAITVGLQAARDRMSGPAYQLLIYPATDHTIRRRSRELYGEGFLLTDASMTWYGDHYAGSADRSDPLLSPLLAGNLHELAPAYVAVAGFDPLRDEGEAFAGKLAAAGVPVTLRRFDDLIHGYANFLGFSARAREAMRDAATALGQALAAPERGVAERDAS